MFYMFYVRSVTNMYVRECNDTKQTQIMWSQIRRQLPVDITNSVRWDFYRKNNRL